MFYRGRHRTEIQLRPEAAGLAAGAGLCVLAWLSGYNEVEIQRGMTTSSTAIFYSLYDAGAADGWQALYYGMNALSHNVIMADRKKLKSANGLYLGSRAPANPLRQNGSCSMCSLPPQDRIIMVDPMGEYSPLVKRLGGQVIEIAPDSPHHINPMDIELNLTEESPMS